MGNGCSCCEEHEPALVLQPPPERICAIEPRFCLSQPLILHLREKMWSWSGDDFTITEVSTGTLYFQCTGKFFTLRDKKILCDNTGNPILNMQSKILSLSDTYKIYAGIDDTNRELLKSDTHVPWFGTGSKLTTAFTDILNGKHRLIVLKGSWRDKLCNIYLGDPDEAGGASAIAKICRPWTERSAFGADEYFLEITPGVDIALMVVLCIALDEHAHENHDRHRHR